MMHASTSPFYPLFASLDVNAKMQEGEAGRRLWADCVKTTIDARKLLLDTCHHIKPFIPNKVRGADWKSYPTNLIAQDLEFLNLFQAKNGTPSKATVRTSTLLIRANSC